MDATAVVARGGDLTKKDVVPVEYVVGVDPGRASAFSVWTCSPRPVLVGCGAVRDMPPLKTKDYYVLDQLRGCNLHVWPQKGRTVGALEQMRAGAFMSSPAAESFHESRGRWREALKRCGIRELVDVNVQTWRKRSGLREWALNSGIIPNKKVPTEKWKQAAMEYAEKISAGGVITRNPDLAEAVCIGYAGALLVFFCEVRLDD